MADNDGSIPFASTGFLPLERSAAAATLPKTIQLHSNYHHKSLYNEKMGLR